MRLNWPKYISIHSSGEYHRKHLLILNLARIEVCTEKNLSAMRTTIALVILGTQNVWEIFLSFWWEIALSINRNNVLFVIHFISIIMMEVHWNWMGRTSKDTRYKYKSTQIRIYSLHEFCPLMCINSMRNGTNINSYHIINTFYRLRKC